MDVHVDVGSGPAPELSGVVTIDPKLVELAVTGLSSGDDPLVHLPGARKKLRASRRAAALREAEIDRDIKLSRAVVDDIARCVTPNVPVPAVLSRVDERVHVALPAADDELPGSLTLVVPCTGSEQACRTVSYVCVESMPPELQEVIRAYVGMLMGRSGASDIDALRRSVDSLSESVKRVNEPLT